MKKIILVFSIALLFFLVGDQQIMAANVGTADRTMGNLTLNTSTAEYNIHINTQATKDYRPVQGGLTIKTITETDSNIQKFETNNILITQNRSYIAALCTEDRLDPENIGRWIYFYFSDSDIKGGQDDNASWQWVSGDAQAMDMIRKQEALSFYATYQKGDIVMNTY